MPTTAPATDPDTDSATARYCPCHCPQEATDIYKRLLLENREYLALNVYVALCYCKLDYYDVSLEILQASGGRGGLAVVAAHVLGKWGRGGAGCSGSTCFGQVGGLAGCSGSTCCGQVGGLAGCSGGTCRL